MVQVFLSHSKLRSKQVAEFFHANLRKVFQDIDTWISSDPRCLPLGRYDHSRIVDAAIESAFCLSVLDEENVNSPWPLFEPGMFYGQRKEVISLLCGSISHAQLKSRNFPLEGYHGYPDENSLRNLLLSINQHTGRREEVRFADQMNQFITDFTKFYPTVYA